MMRMFHNIVYLTPQAKHATIIRVMYLCGHCFLKLLQAYFYAWYGNIIAIEVNSTKNIFNLHFSNNFSRKSYRATRVKAQYTSRSGRDAVTSVS